MDRRHFYAALSSGLASPCGVRAASAATGVFLKHPGGLVSPSVRGRFIEHLGKVISDHIRVGENSRIPHTGGTCNTANKVMKPLKDSDRLREILQSGPAKNDSDHSVLRSPTESSPRLCRCRRGVRDWA